MAKKSRVSRPLDFHHDGAERRAAELLFRLLEFTYQEEVEWRRMHHLPTVDEAVDGALFHGSTSGRWNPVTQMPSARPCRADGVRRGGGAKGLL